jgi:capsid protein
VLQALIGIFVKSPHDNEVVQQALGDGLGFYQDMRGAFGEQNPPTMIGGLRIPKLFPGESIESVKSVSTLTEFEAFEHIVLRSVAAATGASAEEVTRDYSQLPDSRSGRLMMPIASPKRHEVSGPWSGVRKHRRLPSGS